MSYFEQDETIFENQDVLRDDYQPTQFGERDEELEAYKAALQPVVDGAQPRNIFIYGKTGVGKTAVTTFLLDKLQEDIGTHYPDIDLSTVLLNCNGLTSSYQVAVHLVNKLADTANQIPPTGLPARTVYERLYEEINRRAGTVLIVLDEIDSIGDDDDLLYELPRARSNNYVTESKPGIIGISNDFSFRDTLSPKVEDTLCEREIHFPPYDALELQNILDRRAELAFYDGVLDDDVIPLCSALAAKDRGSARQALDLLFEAADLTRQREEGRVTVEHVRDAQHVLEEKKIQECMRELTMHGHLVLCAIVSLGVNDETPTRSQRINERYQKLCEQVNEDPLSLRSVRNHLNDLLMLGILDADERNTGRKGGSYFNYRLGVPIESALDALDEIYQQSQIDVEYLRRTASRQGMLD